MLPFEAYKKVSGAYSKVSMPSNPTILKKKNHNPPSPVLLLKFYERFHHE